MPHPTTRPDAAGEAVTARCAARYLADLVPAYAFVFTMSYASPRHASRFTLYDTQPDRYAVGAAYLLTLTEADPAPASPAPRTEARP